jgi:hypothetical protein
MSSIRAILLHLLTALSERSGHRRREIKGGHRQMRTITDMELATRLSNIEMTTRSLDKMTDEDFFRAWDSVARFLAERGRPKLLEATAEKPASAPFGETTPAELEGGLSAAGRDTTAGRDTDAKRASALPLCCPAGGNRANSLVSLVRTTGYQAVGLPSYHPDDNSKRRAGNAHRPGPGNGECGFDSRGGVSTV